LPSSSISYTVSWGAYLSASLALAALLSPAVGGSVRSSYASSTESIVSGLATAIDGLSPGLGATVSFETPFAGLSVSLQGHSVTGTSSYGRTTAYVVWELPTMILESGVAYRVSLRGAAVSVVASG
jgi:hypothetical protein